MRMPNYFIVDNPDPIPYDTMYLIRFCVIDHGARTGRRAYDMYETMNRLAFFQQRELYRHDAVVFNIDLLERARSSDHLACNVMYQDPRKTINGIDCTARPPVYIEAEMFFENYGVRCETSCFEEERHELFDTAMVDAVEAQEDGHRLWNMSAVEFFSDETAGTTDEEDAQVYTSRDIDELLQDSVGSFEEALEINPEI